MNWSTLTLGEVGILFAGAAALAIWLYLRQPRAARLRVSTLRFWENAPSGAASARRRKLRDILPLLAQLLFLLLAIAALGNPHLGAVSEGRSVVLVLDAGAWSQMRLTGTGQPANATELDQIRAEANALLAQLPLNDRVLLLRADSDGAPLVPFTTDRGTVRTAIANLQSSSAVADVPHALAQARGALDGEPTSARVIERGLLVYIGPGMVDQKQATALEDFRASLAQPAQPSGAAGAADPAPEFLVRLAGTAAPPRNIGITHIALKRNPAAADEWSVMTQLRNYNDQPARVTLSLSVGGHVFRKDDLSIDADSTQSAGDDFTSRTGGLLDAEVTPGDDLAADNHATIVLPSSQPISVAVVSSRPAFSAKMKTVLSANPYVETNFVSAGAATPASEDVIIYDGEAPAGSSAAATIEFLPPDADASTHRVRLANWNSGHPVTRWIESRDVTVRAAKPLTPAAGDIVLASSSASTPGAASQPLIIAHETNSTRSVAVDFDPLDSNFTEEPAFPLLIAASLEWMTHPVQEEGEFLAAGSVDLPALSISRIVTPSNHDILFATDDSSAHFYAPESGVYRVTSAGQSLDVPVNVPSLPTVRIAPVRAEVAALAPQPVPIEQQDLWRWLVGFALIALWLEWQFFYFRRERATQPASMPSIGINSQSTSRDPRGDSGDESHAQIPAVRA